jgi:ribose 1,5-bisphosphate isomerase
MFMDALPEKVEEIAQDIKTMKIRGAGKIARAAVGALKITAEASKAETIDKFILEMDFAAKSLLRTRPTAVSLPNGIRYVMGRLTQARNVVSSVNDLRKHAMNAADEFIENSMTAVQRIGEFGAKRIKDGDIILTHCHSSAVAAIIKRAWEQGKKVQVYSTETRPRFQGRITAKNLGEAGIPVTMIVDSAARHFMDEVDKVIVGADAIAANGAVVNKIGTSMVALAAHEAGVLFFVAAETYKFSPETMVGELIVLEERAPSEVISPERLKNMENVGVRNPSFDITPAEYIDLIITEKGIIPPQGAISILQEIYDYFSF